ncbi:MAG: hypothetical protein RLO01_09205 [Thalassobaculaceae bacterium]|uniref:phospholipase D-like domain-containing protein n=1 Tax=Roseitalea porphyridii TaxID=1852022 RepID=UPI0032EB1113
MKQLDTWEQMENGAMSRRSAEAMPSAGDHHVTPLLEASEAYPALEERIYAARTEVLLGFRLLDPKTRIRSGELRRAGITNWGDLIAAVAARGVDVRILLTDFEPTVATHLHTLTWAAVRGFLAASSTPSSSEDRAHSERKRTPQIIAALHEARVGRALRYMLWPVVWLRVRRLAAARGMSRAALLQDAPGLAPLLGSGRWDVLARSGPPRLRPATYHQKLAIIDGEYLVIGGLDIDERRFDDATHDRPADDTWHDLSLLITGPVCADARSHFVDCWNREVRPFRRRVRRLRRFVRDLPAPPDPLTSPPGSADDQGRPAASADGKRKRPAVHPNPVAAAGVAGRVRAAPRHPRNRAGPCGGDRPGGVLHLHRNPVPAVAGDRPRVVRGGPALA